MPVLDQRHTHRRKNIIIATYTPAHSSVDMVTIQDKRRNTQNSLLQHADIISGAEEDTQLALEKEKKLLAKEDAAHTRVHFHPYS